MDTRTPRTPTGGRSSGLDEAPALSMVKVPSDPAQVIVSHASFRVQLGVSSRCAQSPRIVRHLNAAEQTARVPVVTTVGAPDRPEARRRPVVWSGRSAPDDTGAHRLLQAVRHGGVHHADEPLDDTDTTQAIPHVGDVYGDAYGYAEDPAARTFENPVVGSQRTHDGRPLLPPMRTVESAYDDQPAGSGTRYQDQRYGGQGYDEIGHGHQEYGERGHGDDEYGVTGDRRDRRHGDDPARHAYYPGRRMNLGVVLLPLRLFLGFISIYAGMGKLCDPLYFDGGERGSMVKWLTTLRPWEIAQPLQQFALEHPVGAGLLVAFLQVIVGVLTILGCWQRVGAVIGVLLSAALLVTVSWKSVPAYDTPDIIYLAAWSPLVIAGAPVYSVDGRLAARAWRRLGPGSAIGELRRYVLRRGALVTVVVCGLTLLVGSLLGGAVRDADRVVVPGPGEAPRNELPGSPLPEEPGEHGEETPSATISSTPGSGSGADGTDPSADTTTPGVPTDTGGSGVTGVPSHTQGTVGEVLPQQPPPVEQDPGTSSGPTSGGGATGSDSGGTPGDLGEGGDEGEAPEERGRLVGGLLG